MRRQPQNRKGRNTVKRSTLTLLLILTLALAAPAFAQHSHPGGGPPAGHGPGSDPGTSPGMSGAHSNSAAARSDVSHGTPSDVLSHNTAVAGKIDRKSTRLNSSHTVISYAVFCLKKKKKKI